MKKILSRCFKRVIKKRRVCFEFPELEISLPKLSLPLNSQNAENSRVKILTVLSFLIKRPLLFRKMIQELQCDCGIFYTFDPYYDDLQKCLDPVLEDVGIHQTDIFNHSSVIFEFLKYMPNVVFPYFKLLSVSLKQLQRTFKNDERITKLHSNLQKMFLSIQALSEQKIREIIKTLPLPINHHIPEFKELMLTIKCTIENNCLPDKEKLGQIKILVDKFSGSDNLSQKWIQEIRNNFNLPSLIQLCNHFELATYEASFFLDYTKIKGVIEILKEHRAYSEETLGGLSNYIDLALDIESFKACSN